MKSQKIWGNETKIVQFCYKILSLVPKTRLPRFDAIWSKHDSLGKQFREGRWWATSAKTFDSKLFRLYFCQRVRIWLTKVALEIEMLRSSWEKRSSLVKFPRSSSRRYSDYSSRFRLAIALVASRLRCLDRGCSRPSWTGQSGSSASPASRSPSSPLCQLWAEK